MPNAIQDPLDRLTNIIDGEKSPFVELSERIRINSKDVNNLNLSILDLAIALEKRAGIKREKPKEAEAVVEQKRTLSDDAKDFARGFADYFKEKTDYITSKTDENLAVDKVSTDNTIEEEQKIVETENTNTEQNKILSDMVGVLIDMRDDKSQKQLVEEANAIKNLISNQNKRIELPGGIEPNTEEVKETDREKLADLIARKLGEVMSDLGIGSNSGLNVDIPDAPNKKPTNKPGRKTPRVPAGVGNAARLGGRLLGGAGLAYGVYEAMEYLDQIDYGESMAEGAGKDAEKAFRENVAPTIDPIKANISKDEALAALENGTERDIEKLGGVDTLRKVAGLPPLEKQAMPEPKQTTPFEQASLRKYDYVEPKPVDNNIGTILNEVSDKNTELKMFNIPSAQSQTIAPIVSNNTVNNTEQTMIATPPTPHSNASAFNKWRSKRSNYTD